MSTALQYPEFLLAFFLGLVFLVKNQRSPGNLPLWLTAPAMVLLRRLPEGYQRWLAKLQLWSGWRSNTAFGALALPKFIRLFSPVSPEFFYLSG